MGDRKVLAVLMDLTHVASLLIVSVAGLVRGMTGFGGAMLMTPLLSALIGPTQAVVTALILEIGGASVMFPEVLPKVRWRMLGYLTLPALLTVPLGGYILLTVDPSVARKMIAAVVVFFSGIMLLGWRYSGSPRPLPSMALGSLVGVLLGATSVGAPPVIIYLLSGPDPIVVTRANLTIFVSAISIIGVAMLAVAGAITWRLALSAGFLTMPFLFATWLGGKLFRRSSEPTARRFALTVMISVAVASLFI
jgi:uncharacterized protein